MIDENGYRLNVGIILINKENQVFLGRRIGKKSWQFPQGGIDENETEQQAMYRELYEEIGLGPEDVKIIGCTNNWLTYDLPERYQRKNSVPICVGQKQKWFLLRLVTNDNNVCFSNGKKAEFDHFKWVNYWYPIKKVIFFKRLVYKKALTEFSEVVSVKPRSLTIHRFRKASKYKRSSKSVNSTKKTTHK